MSRHRRERIRFEEEDEEQAPKKRSLPRERLKPEALLEIPKLRRHTSGPGGRLNFEMQEIEDLAAVGLSQEQIARSLACNPSTIVSRLATDAEFRAAYEKGKARMRAAIATGLLYKAVGEQNLVAQIYLSKVHMGWRDGDSPYTAPPADAAFLAQQVKAQLDALNRDEGAPT